MKINSNLIKSSLIALNLAFPNNAYSESTPIDPNKIEEKLNSLESVIEIELKNCIQGPLKDNSNVQNAFIDALQELREYNMVLSHFHSPALEQYGVNDENNPCYRANEDIKRMNEIIESNL